MIFVLFFVFLTNTDISESHVYCQDAHASRWTPLGYSCPLNCGAVIEAVNRLKEIDFQEFFKLQQNHYAVNTTTSSEEDETEDINSIQSESKRGDNEIKESKEPTTSQYHELYKIILNKKSGNEIQALFKIASAHLKNNTCRNPNKLARKTKFNRFLGKKHATCVRNTVIEKDFLKKFTAILNKYTVSEFFAEDSTAIILGKLLGKSTDLSQEQFDVQNILKDVRQAISKSKVHTRAADSIITLKSKFCLNVYVPGCFCIPGYVEQNGQCVNPQDCFPDTISIREYLARINVN